MSRRPSFCLFLRGCFTQVLLYNMLYKVGLVARKSDFVALEYDKDADQPAHLCSLISAFVIYFLESIIAKLTTVKPFKNKTKIGFQDQLSLNAGQNYCRMLSTFIKLPFVIKIFVSSFFEGPFYTGFTA